MNRLLRCARDNLRPVSLRELQHHPTFSQQVELARIQQMSSQLQARLHDRSGMFQFSDMGEDPIVDPEEISRREHTALQPEEEPTRRASNIEVPEMSLETPVETPIPNDNFESDHAGSSYEPSLAPSNPAEGGENMGENSHVSFGEASSVGRARGKIV